MVHKIGNLKFLLEMWNSIFNLFVKETSKSQKLKLKNTFFAIKFVSENYFASKYSSMLSTSLEVNVHWK